MVSEGLIRDELMRLLKESQILTPAEVERVAEGHPAATRDDLARAFVAAGLLTQFQMDAIIAGKDAELRIGNYDVLDRLGAGGMGTVFKARHRRMKRIVALKVLAKNLSKDAIFVKRFQREVETIAQLNHPNVVMAYDADEAEVGHFLVMEFVNGPDLASVVQKHGPMSVRGALECLLHAARGLAYAHGQNIIHRDIKPANLLRDASGVVKVTDLGLARLSASAMASSETAATSVTQAGSVLGTADYMPPEQAVDSSDVDHRADIYSLGATLYFLLTGRGPYSATSLMAILLKHRDAPIPSLGDKRKDVPPALDELFRKMLAKEPRDRPQEMTQVVLALEAMLTNLGATPAVPQPIAAPLSERPTDASQALDKTVVGGLPGAGNQAEESPGAAATPSIVLVEPSRTQAGIIRKYLQSLELSNIVSVTTGAEALKAIQSHRPDVVITTMHLNDMTGTQLAQRIRGDKSAAAPGFVLISSESESKEAEVLGHSGHAALLHKPFTAESLMNALKLASPVFAALKPPSGSTMVGQKPLQPTRSQCRVLIVDDSTAARVHIRNVLAGLGLTQVSEADDGATAVAILAREKFDLIVTDYNMPLMDGRGLVAYVRQNPATANVPIIMVTTETEPAKLDAVRKLGVTVCEKSFPADVARKVIDTLLRG